MVLRAYGQIFDRICYINILYEMEFFLRNSNFIEFIVVFQTLCFLAERRTSLEFGGSSIFGSRFNDFQ